jgi:nitrite reductase (NO-forming)/hydroxylamine reductase
MPNWGTSGELTDAEVDLMARYPPAGAAVPPEWGMKEMMASLEGHRAARAAPDEEDERLDLDNLFSVTCAMPARSR